MRWDLLYGNSPFEGFDAGLYPLDIQGWNFEAEIFRELVEATRPNLIIEVGTWKGGSAIRMADLSRALGLDTRIVCVDTWLGSLEFWFATEAERCLDRRHGYPQVYFQFLANALKTGNADRIIPLPNTSRTAAAILRGLGVEAELIYIDGSHEYADCLDDLRLYWPLLAEEGRMFGDDYLAWPGVRMAVDDFARERGLAVQKRDGFWLLD